MSRRALRALFAVAALAAPTARAAADPPPATPDESDDAPEVIRPGKRPALKLTGAPPPRDAPGEKVAKGDDEAAPVVPSSYKGVTPGAPNLPPRPPKLPVKGPARMTWPGFQVRGGVPTVFLELTGPVEWTVDEAPGKLVYTLKDTQVHLRNNRRPLKVKEFGTAVREIDARDKGRDVRVTISLARGQKVAHREHTEEAAGGFKLLLVELTAAP